ncbi:GNAT family N-acetyltransferase [Agarivorans sp. MS3-6]|uniref:GNAT family N-acetyltransferase n=1 Tax=Agarivorans sp. TSD2052 TaxID=2937286 RepID=UPI00200D1CE8|nr:GNAT family N-acetyltransferase [Agarivorans sp. TSD2052]UPW18983.1 GNAT family N-acetyltransferase [Agarivorans sp. TSD2052]
MNQNIKIRLAKLDDASAISALLTQLAQRFLVQDFTEAGSQCLLAAMTEQSIVSYIKQGFCYHLAEQFYEYGQPQLLGVVATRDNTHLYHLFVAELAQGQGLAGKLWQQAKAVCLANGNQGEFTVNASLGAKAMYQAWGFVAEQERRENKGIIDVPMRLIIEEVLTKEKQCN